jgi:hypothetical protein
MTGYLMVRCGLCGAPNKVRSLFEVPACVECGLSVSMSETVPTVGTLLCDVHVTPIRISLNEISS